MKILFVYAIEEERGDINIDGHQIFFCKTGFGKVQSVISVSNSVLKIQPDLVINFGSAGTLNHNVGDIFICTKFVDRDLSVISLPGMVSEIDYTEEINHLNFLEGYNYNFTVNTGDSFITEISESLKTADVIDMEAFAIASFCKQNSIPFFSVKYVTDIIGKNSLKAWADKLGDARIALSEFINRLIV